MAGTLLPAADAFGAASGTTTPEHSGIGIRLVDAPVATSDNPRARVYIIDHVRPGSTIKRRIEVSNDTGHAAEVTIYAAAASIDKGAFVGLAGDTPNELSTWTTVDKPKVTLADGAKEVVGTVIEVPADAAPGEQYAVVWAQVTSLGSGAVAQVSRVGIRVYLSVGPGGEPASAFEVRSLTAMRNPSGAPAVTATIHNTGGRALDLRGQLTLSDGPGGLSAGPFPVTLGTTLGRGQTEPVTVQLDEQLPNGPWKAHLEVTSGLLTETAEATLTFPEAGTAEPVVPVADSMTWWWIGGAVLVLALFAAWWVIVRRRGGRPRPGDQPGRADGSPAEQSSPSALPAAGRY